MGPGDLAQVLASVPASVDPHLLVGRETFDDAGVYQLTPDLALVQTVDFFAPIVDDPYTFGRVAATNALSDIYAMGGTPLTALNIVAFPRDRLPLDVLSAILRGGHDAVHAAGAVVIGGHTILDDEPKFGLAVTGRVDPRHILTNGAARSGDRLVLTKPIGNGIIATALKQGMLTGDIREAAELTMIEHMVQLNRGAADAATALGIGCATDITGFGLLGHASHIARASGVTVVIRARDVPLLPGVYDGHAKGARSGGEGRNREYLEPLVAWGRTTEAERAILVDPQTSGGLLLAVPPSVVATYLSRVPGAVEIGEIRGAGPHAVVLE